MAIYKNTTAVSTDLIAKKFKGDGNINNILIANISASAAVVDLSITSSAATFYYFKNVNIPPGSSYLFDEKALAFDGGVYKLTIKNSGGSPSLSIIIK